MNPVAVLGLIGDLYTQVQVLQQENEALRAQLVSAQPKGA